MAQLGPDSSLQQTCDMHLARHVDVNNAKSVSQCITNVSQCITMYHNVSQCITMYHNVSHIDRRDEARRTGFKGLCFQAITLCIHLLL